MTADCEFCQIGAGEAEAHVLYETDEVIAFLDIRPATQGHTLIAPRDHRTELLNGQPELAKAVDAVTRRVAGAIESTLEPEGFSTFYTTGDVVGTVEHAHVHLVPRYEDDGVSISLPRSRLVDGEELAHTIRSVGDLE